MNIDKIKNIGDLKKINYRSKSTKEEVRSNLIDKLTGNKAIFDGIVGFDETVIPDVERAILSRHNILLLGLRGQAKTRIARKLVGLLDEYIPVLADSQLNEDPFNPISKHSKELIEELGDATPINWLHRSERYVEKLATPDVSVADLIGDVDPIKAANMRLNYSDERVIHYGLVPRANRGIFVINELPDLQPRIQVSLFNILQEGDIQIRGFSLRLPLDIMMVFTANPEDYTNRGSIVTPLKDRIESQILTHYVPSIDLSKQISKQEARLTESQEKQIKVAPLIDDLIEQISFVARNSEFIDEKSGVSARMSITARENLYSTAERRALKNKAKKTNARIGDLSGVIPSITGKVELVYEGEQEGAYLVALQLIGKAIREEFTNYFPDPENFKKKKKDSPYQPVIDWFNQSNSFQLLNDCKDSEYKKLLNSIPGLQKLVESYHSKKTKEEQLLLMEFVLHGLAEYSLLSKNMIRSGFEFKDLLGSMFNLDDFASGEKFEEY